MLGCACVAVVPPLLAYATSFNPCYLTLPTPPFPLTGEFVVSHSSGDRLCALRMLYILSYIGFSIALHLTPALPAGSLRSHYTGDTHLYIDFAYLLRCNAPFLYVPITPS